VLTRPTGKSPTRCPAPFEKIILFSFCANHFHGCAIPFRLRGVSRSSRTLERDAVDAGGALTNAPISRTAKPCGPDAPTLASSVADVSAKRWWQQSPVTRESAEETVKTMARGMPDVSGVTVVTNACAFYHCARGCGRAERPAFPAPLLG
jgi:hypothetical protein